MVISFCLRRIMMTIDKKTDGNKMVLTLEGRVDTTTAPQFEAEITSVPEEINDVTIDFKDLQYISSAGLRVLLLAQKTIGKRGDLVIVNVSDQIMEVFDITGFSDILTIK